jgi:hypothetical protein
MFRIGVRLAAMLLVSGLHTASAQTTTAPPTPTDAKPSKVKISMEKLKEMKARWSANRPKLKACRAEVKAKGLVGDERWFYIEDCMSRT